MSAREEPRTQVCGILEAHTRVTSATRFLEVARLVEAEEGGAYRSTAAALAVLAGVAASDAACCARLGRRMRGDDPHDATILLERTEPGGREAATALRRLIGVKNKAPYGLMLASHQNVQGEMLLAQRLLAFGGRGRGGERQRSAPATGCLASEKDHCCLGPRRWSQIIASSARLRSGAARIPLLTPERTTNDDDGVVPPASWDGVSRTTRRETRAAKRPQDPRPRKTIR
jgi:hypothetical protein